MTFKHVGALILSLAALLAFAATESPVAAADLETCVPVIEAEEIYQEAVKPAAEARQTASREAVKAHSDAIQQVNIDLGAAFDARGKDEMEVRREFWGVITLEERAEMNARIDAVHARHKPEFDRIAAARKEAGVARSRAQDEAEAAYVRATASADKAWYEAVLQAYYGPTSDNPKVMERLLIMFVEDCWRLFE